ncbi:hypothetical protein DEU56DRAFT_802770 [Suillus clintonianus]|uniref:uncharacterized protein n=1 Tax=Suillus clintonianus TaxID=1904413 RepID=UPI001B867F60|nr:uncharacterized protein DEU56DRAFT_802770 [Suillus clintonianus]KAG2138339.1 hypothetical protein DEU56DRAFT_802770 [Suillus clintonianus]
MLFSQNTSYHRPSFRCVTIAHPKAASSTPQTAPHSSRKHVHVNADGVEVELRLWRSLCRPRAWLSSCQIWRIGNLEKGFTIIRKIGWGMNSSIWMAFDETDKKYVAIKALKEYSSGLFELGMMVESLALERSTLASPAPGLTSSHCLHLLCFLFKRPGKDRDGRHLCYVTDVLGGDIKSELVRPARRITRTFMEMDMEGPKESSTHSIRQPLGPNRRYKSPELSRFPGIASIQGSNSK